MLKMITKAQNAVHAIRNFKFAKDENGATAIEYGLIAAGIAIAIVVIVFAVGNELSSLFTRVQTNLAR
jgi:pilus assembly protein Flp/PilA